MWEGLTREDLSVFLGWVSIACWVPVTIPELIEIWYLKSADAVSLPFIFLWASGDVCNLVGCVLTGQLSTQTYLASWYVCSDALMVSLCLYFDFIYVRKKPSPGEADPLMKARGQQQQKPKQQQVGMHTYGLLVVAATLCALLVSSSSRDGGVGERGTVWGPQRVLLGLQEAHNDSSSSNVVGQIVAWVSTCLYLTAKLPQIHRNYARKSTEGLSAKMFILCICANISYLGSILAHSTSWENIMHSLPYIVGAMTMPFDLTILYQIWYFSKVYPKKHGYEPIDVEPAVPTDMTPDTAARYRVLRHSISAPAAQLHLPEFYQRPILSSVRSGGFHHAYNGLVYTFSQARRARNRRLLASQSASF